MKASDFLKKKGADNKKSDTKGGNKLIDWIGKRRGKAAVGKSEDKGEE
jgi:hypothetical protein